MKTKEEIIRAELGKRFDIEPEKIYLGGTKSEESTFAAMNEWAIHFGKWIQGCNYAPATEEGKWQNQLPGENDVITTEELYQTFENQNK